MSRRAFVCRDTSGTYHCTTVIVGDDEEEIAKKAERHYVDAHDVEATPELRRVILASLRVEEEEEEEMDRRDHFDMVHEHPHPLEEDVDVDIEARDGFSTPGQ
ncbi:MAG: DUF1059 domain-containing protein [Myxococcota bacterium]